MRPFLFLLGLFFTFSAAYGQNWTVQNFDSTQFLVQVRFESGLKGYAVGNNGLVMVTGDGATWNRINIGTSGDCRSIACPATDTTYICGAQRTIMKTTDGGAHWIAVNPVIPITLLSLYFTDARTGYAVGQDGIILKTTDGGANWSTQSSGTQQLLSSVCFPVKDTGYVAGANGTFLQTTNGGITWTHKSIASAGNLHSVFFTNAETGFLIGSFETWGSVYKTTNGGSNWSFQTLTSNYLYDLCFPDARTGYATGGYTDIFKTTDGGATWKSESIDTNDYRDYRGICFTNANTGYVVGSYGTILQTTNGGGFPSSGIFDKQSGSVALQIVPNPATDHITIATSWQPGLTLSVLDLDGRELQTMVVGQPSTRVDLSSYPNGVYYVRLTGQNTVQVGKVIKL